MSNGLTDLNLLYDSFRAAFKGSAWKEEPQRFEIDFLSEIVRLKHEIDARVYCTSPGIEFELNERGKVRHIHGSRIRDRVVRHAMCDGELTEALRPFLIHNNGASQKGKGISFTRAMFERDLHNYWLKYRTNEGYIAFVDISRYYDNIPHAEIKRRVYPLLSEEGRWLMDETLHTFEVDVSYMTEEEYSRCMAEKFNSVWYYEHIPAAARTREKYMQKGVDIGDLVSQSIGVYYPTPIDNYCKIVRGCKWYGRYMDDMYIIHRDRNELKSIIAGIVRQAGEMGMFINQKKTRIFRLCDTYKFLQIRYSLSPTGKVIKRINPKAVTRERRRMKAYKHLMDDGKMAYADVEQACKSWMGDYARIMSRDQINHMKSHYKALFGKELSWKPKSSSRTGRK